MGRALGLVLVFMIGSLPMRAAEHTLVLVPPTNVSGADEAPDLVYEAFVRRIEARGWTVAPPAEVDAALEAGRVRYLDSLPDQARLALIERFHAKAIVFGTIVGYRDDANPMLAVSARMIDKEGHVVWSELAVTSAQEAEGILGIGRPPNAGALATKLTARLFRSFPKKGILPVQQRARTARRSLLSGDPVTYRSASHPRGAVRRLCVLPFTSSLGSDAPRVLAELLTIRLEASGEFEVVEPAELRNALRAERRGTLSSVTSAELARLGTRLGTTLFLRGNIYTFREGGSQRSEIQLDLNLADVATGEVLWAVTHQRRGTDYAGPLQLGTVETAIGLADRVVSEIVGAQERASLRTAKRKAPMNQARKEQ